MNGPKTDAGVNVKVPHPHWRHQASRDDECVANLVYNICRFIYLERISLA
ncbi:hypothetical protein [Labrys neptuniae]